MLQSATEEAYEWWAGRMLNGWNWLMTRWPPCGSSTHAWLSLSEFERVVSHKPIWLPIAWGRQTVPQYREKKSGEYLEFLFHKVWMVTSGRANRHTDRRIGRRNLALSVPTVLINCPHRVDPDIIWYKNHRTKTDKIQHFYTQVKKIYMSTFISWYLPINTMFNFYDTCRDW